MKGIRIHEVVGFISVSPNMVNILKEKGAPQRILGGYHYFYEGWKKRSGGGGKGHI